MTVRWAVTVSLLWLFLSPVAAAESPIRFGETRLENHFPDELAFEVVAESDAGEIVAGRLLYALRNATSVTEVILEVEPASRVTLRYAWDTSQITVPPSAPVFYHWEVTDAAGNRASSDEALFFYDDVRFDWQVREDTSIAVWWHDRPVRFGEQVFDIAQRAVGKQRGLFQAELDYQIRVIVYNDFEEFAGWHSFVSEFVGGQAFTSLGITTQIVSAFSSQELWLNDVIPHEIAHLYFYQVTDHPLADPPLWLNEGLAQYNEFRDHAADLAYARQAVLAGDLIPLRAISGSFGNQEAQVRLAYAESLSAVTYMVEAYGPVGIGDLMAAFGQGRATNQAFQEALGLGPDAFEADWLVWLGVPPGTYLTPTPYPTLKPLPSPPMMSGLPPASRTPTPPGHAPTATAASPRPTDAGASAPPPQTTPAIAPTSVLAPVDSSAVRVACCLCPLMSLSAGLLLLGVALFFGRRWLGGKREA